jgi:hypothetical protein
MPDSFSIQNSKDPFDKYRIERGREEPSQKREQNARTQKARPFLFFFLVWIKKILDLFATQKNIPYESSMPELRDHLLFLKSALELLMERDYSQESSFLQELAKLWHQLLKDAAELNKNSPPYTHLRALIRELQHYPGHQEHSLAYYLSEYAGQQWLPFPYIEMIKQLHLQHKNAPKTSMLTKWRESLEELISSIQH